MVWVIFAGILLLNSLAAISIAAVLVSRGIHKPGSKMMNSIFAALALWTFSYAMITLAPSMAAKIFWLKIENIGIIAIPVLWFLFTLSYTKQNRWVNRGILALLFLIPTVTMSLLFTESWFHLYYIDLTLVNGLLGPVEIYKGTWYWVQFFYSYTLLTIGLIILLRHIFIFRDNYRKSALTLLAAFLIPVVLNLFYQLGGKLFPSLSVSFDLTPISFTLTAILLRFAIFQQKLFEMTPIARYIVFEYIVEMVIVVDDDDFILDVNGAAAKWLGISIDEIVGKTIANALTTFPKIVSYYINSKKEKQSFHLFTDPEYMVEITISPIRNRYSEIEGRVIVLHDVTEQRQMEGDLQKANEELKEKLAEIEILQAQLKEQAIRDPLTGLYNRRYLAEALDREIAQAEREKLPISAVIMDVDHFKNFNDQYGHKCGDHVLEYLGKLLLSNTRRGDTVCRYGGEEFVILMPKIGIDVARARAETWRKSFSNAAIHYEGQALHAELSAGIACYPIGVKNGEDLLKAADQALYYSKKHGRNCVTIYPMNLLNEEIYVKP